MKYLVLFAPEVNALATKRNDVQCDLSVEELTCLINMLEDERLRVWYEQIGEIELMDKPIINKWVGEI